LAQITDLDWRATIVGGAHDPAHADALADLVRTLDLSGRVTLAGRVAQDDLEPLYAQATLFTLATRYEGYGIVFDEALARGLPIVSCATGAVPQTVPKDAGLLVPVGDVTALAAALRSILSNPQMRAAMTTAAREAGDALPTWADTARTASGVLNAL
jgi:glycosyltransferase involved in cell wall biosynthesis